LSTNQIQDLYWKGGQHGMGKPYSEDLRERVVGRRRMAPRFREQRSMGSMATVVFDKHIDFDD
jgi:hypothetical protein